MASIVTGKRPMPPSVTGPTSPRIGVALSGGAAFGLAHIGALQVLETAGIRPVAVAGTSMGALVGAFYAAGKLDALTDWATGLGRYWWLPVADPVWRGSGMIAGNRILRTLRRQLGDRRIEDLPVPFAAMATDLRHETAVTLTTGRVSDVVRAAISVPGVFAGVERACAFLVDGAIADPVPVAAVRGLGADRVIAIDVLQDHEGEALAAGLIAADDSGRRGKPHTRAAAVSTVAAGAIMRRIIAANQETAPPDFTIAPRVAHLGISAFHRARAFIDIGAAAAAEALAQMPAELRGSGQS